MFGFITEVEAGPGSGPTNPLVVGAGAGSKGGTGEGPVGLFNPDRAHTAINNVLTWD